MDYFMEDLGEDDLTVFEVSEVLDVLKPESFKRLVEIPRKPRMQKIRKLKINLDIKMNIKKGESWNK